MKLFGEFLIEKGSITAAQLLTALIDQTKSVPPLCEIVWATKLLNENELVAILAGQTKSRCGFVESARALGFWNDSISVAVDKELTKARTPLGQILVEKGSIQADMLSKLLDEFLDEVKVGDSKHERKIPEIQSKVKETETAQDPQAKGNGPKDNQLPYLEVFTQKQNDDMLGMIGFIDCWDDLIGAEKESVLQSFVDFAHTLVGTARMCELPNSESLFGAIESYLRSVIEKKSEFKNSEILAMQEKVKAAWNIGWEIRKRVENCGEESASDGVVLQKKEESISHLMKG